MKKLLFLISIAIFSQGTLAVDLEVSITGARTKAQKKDSKEPKMNVLVFDEAAAEAFPSDVKAAKVALVLTMAESEKFVVSGLEEGFYAIAIHHDENGDGEMQKGTFGIPKEGFGFSNNAMGTFGPPKFKKAKVEVKGPTTQTTLKVKYF